MAYCSYAYSSPIKKVTSLEGISEYQLDNGLKVLLAPDHSKERITVNMSYKVGSRHEGPGETGMAHLLEHLLFKASPNFPDALSEFSKRGMAANGSTTADLTNYYASFSADKDTLHWFLRWQADAMVHASISQTDLNAEMTVVRNELERGDNSPFTTLIQQVNAAAYIWHPYGRSVIGAKSDIENIKATQLRRFYEKYYQPDNAVLIITGDFDVQQTLQWITAIFANIPKPERILSTQYTVEPTQQGPRDITLKRSGGSPMAVVQFHIPSASNDAYTALALGTAMLADSPAGPLYKDLVDSQKASYVFGFARAMNKPGYTLLGAQVQDHNQAQEVLELLKKSVSKTNIDSLTEADLNRIKTDWLNDWEKIYNSQSSLASALSDAVANGDWRLFLIERERIKSASLKDIKTELKNWLVPNNRTSGLYLPTEHPVYATTAKPSQLQPWLAQLPQNSERKTISSFNTAPQAINQATELSTIKMDNGIIKLALLAKETAGNEVYANMRLHFGTGKQMQGLNYVPQLTAALLNKGTSKLSRQQIKDRLTELNSDLYFSGHDNILNVSIRSTSANLAQVLDLSFKILRKPSLPEHELNKIKANMLSSLENQSNSPAWLVSNTLERNQQPWDKNDLRYTPDAKEARALIEQISLKDITSFYKQFYGAGYISFAAVGEFLPKQVKTQLQQLSLGWRQAPEYQRIEQPWYAVTPKEYKIITPGKANANYLANSDIQIQDTDPDWLALFVANYLIGGSEDSLLWQEVRSQQGLSYSVGSSIQSSPWEPNASWTIFASAAPANIKQLNKSIVKVLDKTIKQGFSQAQVEQGVSSLLNFLKLGRSSDANLASRWLRYIDLGRDFSWDANTIQKLQQLQANDVNQAMRKYLDVNNLSTAIAYDENKAN